jgi:putative membrane protein
MAYWDGNDMMYWGTNDIGGWGIAIMVISMTLFWGAVILGIVLLARAVGNNPQKRGELATSGRAESTLADRFARGEIDEVEYRNRLAALRE